MSWRPYIGNKCDVMDDKYLPSASFVVARTPLFRPRFCAHWVRTAQCAGVREKKKMYLFIYICWFYYFFFFPIYKMQLLLCFQTADVKMLVLADLCPCFHRSPTKLCPDLVSFSCWIVTEFWSFTRKRVPRLGHSHSKLCPILYRLCSKLCPNFGCSHARLCPISFAPCPFPT